MSLVLFSGGRGNKNLLRALECGDPTTSIKFNIIVNGLDDGASTGMIREFFDNDSHGISDFLKVTLAISPRRDVIEILESRLPQVNDLSDCLKFSKDLHDFIFFDIDMAFLSGFAIDADSKSKIKAHFLNFLEYFYTTENSLPNLGDFKLGNIVFTSMLINAKLNFDIALEEFIRFCEVDSERFGIVQSTETVSFLVGTLKNGVLLPNEAAVVLTRTSDHIDKTFQIPQPLTASEIRSICSLELENKNQYLCNLEDIPSVGKGALQCIQKARAIVFGAGTPYSSLLPSLELKGMAEAIKESKVPKILVVNLVKETANMMSGVDLITSVLSSLEKSNSGPFDPRDYITHVIAPYPLETDDQLPYIIDTQEGDVESQFEWIKVCRADIRSPHDHSQHDGKRLAECILSILSDD